MPIETVELLLALLAGAGLGAFYFTGLWWTVRQLATSQYVALLFMFSLLCRSSIVIIGFYFILGDNWLRLVVGLVGFIVVRLVATRLINRIEQNSPFEKKEATYESNL